MSLLVASVAIALAAIAIRYPKWRLPAIAVSLTFGFPALVPTGGLRAAVYTQEVVLFAVTGRILMERGLTGRQGLLSAPFAKHLLLIVVYATLNTGAGYIRLGSDSSDVVIRSFLATARLTGVALSFMIPALQVNSRRSLHVALRYLLIAATGFTILAAAEFSGLLVLDKTDSTLLQLGANSGFGAFNRASTGTIATLAIFAATLALYLRLSSALLTATRAMAFVWLLLASLSRTSVLSGGLFIALAWITTRLRRWRGLLVLLAIASATGLFVSRATNIETRLASLVEVLNAPLSSDDSGRVEGWADVLQYLRHDVTTAIWGTGYDCWQHYLTNATALAAGHNVLIQVWVELGLIGGLAYLALFGRIFMQYARSALQTGESRIVGTLGVCLLAALSLASATAEVLYPTVTMISAMHGTMFVLGTLTGYLRNAHQEATPIARFQSTPRVFAESRASGPCRTRSKPVASRTKVGP